MFSPCWVLPHSGSRFTIPCICLQVWFSEHHLNCIEISCASASALSRLPRPMQPQGPHAVQDMGTTATTTVGHSLLQLPHEVLPYSASSAHLLQCSCFPRCRASCNRYLCLRAGPALTLSVSCVLACARVIRIFRACAQGGTMAMDAITHTMAEGTMATTSSPVSLLPPCCSENPSCLHEYHTDEAVKCAGGICQSTRWIS